MTGNSPTEKKYKIKYEEKRKNSFGSARARQHKKSCPYIFFPLLMTVLNASTSTYKLFRTVCFSSRFVSSPVFTVSFNAIVSFFSYKLWLVFWLVRIVCQSFFFSFILNSFHLKWSTWIRKLPKKRNSKWNVQLGGWINIERTHFAVYNTPHNYWCSIVRIIIIQMCVQLKIAEKHWHCDRVCLNVFQHNAFHLIARQGKKERAFECIQTNRFNTVCLWFGDSCS